MEIKETVSFISVKDSNLFLRKLWSELDKIRDNGWLFSPFRKENKITIGKCNFGAVSFDYNVKGCIENIYFDCEDENDVSRIRQAIKNARNINETITYFVQIELPIRICCDKCEQIQTGIDFDNEKTLIHTKVEAFSPYDFNNLIMRKIEAIKAILAVYFRRICSLDEIKVIRSATEFSSIDITTYTFKDCHEYNIEWIDLDDIPVIDKEIYVAPREFLVLIDYIMRYSYFSEDIEAIINASFSYYSSIYLKKISENNKFDSKGCINISNTMIVGALEPLASIENVEVFRCKHCGKEEYFVLKKMRKLLERYFDSKLVKYIMEQYYEKRCKFVHEGKRDTEAYLLGASWPQIDEHNPTRMVLPASILDYNMLDWVGYVIRKRVKDFIAPLEKDF